MRKQADSNYGTRNYEKGVIFCIAVLIGVYALALAIFPFCVGDHAWIYEGQWGKYLFQIVKMGVMAVCFIKAFKCWKTGDKRTLVMLYVTLAFLVTMLGNFISFIEFIKRKEIIWNVQFGCRWHFIPFCFGIS